MVFRGVRAKAKKMTDRGGWRGQIPSFECLKANAAVQIQQSDRERKGPKSDNC